MNKETACLSSIVSSFMLQKILSVLGVGKGNSKKSDLCISYQFWLSVLLLFSSGGSCFSFSWSLCSPRSTITRKMMTFRKKRLDFTRVCALSIWIHNDLWIIWCKRVFTKLLFVKRFYQCESYEKKLLKLDIFENFFFFSFWKNVNKSLKNNIFNQSFFLNFVSSAIHLKIDFFIPLW